MRVAAMLAALLLSGAAHADGFDGWYVGAGVTAQSKINGGQGDAPKPALAIFGGHNWQRGPLVIGMEAHARFDPDWRTIYEFRDGEFTYTTFDKIAAAADARLRVGYAIEKTMIYGRLGLGVARADSKYEFFYGWPSSRRGVRDYETLEFVTIGAGVEHNVGRMFVRGDVGMRRFITFNDVNQYEATAAFGLRF